MIQLQDNDPMPFGKHKGTPMIEVPAQYLHWCWNNERDPLKNKVKVDPVADYIKRNMLELMDEYKDGIWE